MYDFESLSQEVLSRKVGMTRTVLNDLVEQKKKAVGGGYLTDQGALFLVAGDLGVQLERNNSSDLTLKDLYIGANDITITARVLAIYPVGIYTKKEENAGKYRRLSLFDKNGIVKATIWENVDIVERVGLKIGQPVRIVNGYVRQSLDGKPALNVGKKGRIEILNEEDLKSKIPSLSDLTIGVGSIDANDLVAVYGRVKSESNVRDFMRKDGSRGTMTHFVLEGENEGKERRVVIWGGVDIPVVKNGQLVRITNLKQKQQSYGDAELHGDSGSIVEILSSDPSTSVFVVLSCVREAESVDMIVSDTRKILSRLSLRGGARECVRDVREGDVIEVNGGRKSDDMLVCTEEKFIRLVPKKPTFLPSIQSLLVKVKDVGGLVGRQLLEVIALSNVTVRDVQTKDGSAAKAELVVGDDTGTIGLVSWKEDVAMLEGIRGGEKLSLIGVTVGKSKMNTSMLQLDSWSRVIRLDTPVSADDTLGLGSS